MAIHRLKHNFTAGEISPLTSKLVEFSRYKNGCHQLINMIPIAQGPVTRRTGFEFIYDLSSLGVDTDNPGFREIAFTYTEDLAYNLIFFNHTIGNARMVISINDGLIVYPDPPPTECPVGTPMSPLPIAGDVVYLELPGFDTAAFDFAQSGDEITIAQSGLQPHVITRYSHTCWTLSAATYTAQPTDWSDANGWPETVTYFQQRLLFGGNILRPHTVWASKAGDFIDFTTGTNDDDGFAFTLNSGTQNKIMWMDAKKALNIGTLGNEWTVTGATSHAITPTNILAKLQSDKGSAKMKPLSVDFTTLFTERFGRTVKEYVYDYMFDSYKTIDLSVLAPHLTEHFSIIGWAYQQVPYSIVWAIRSDGRLVGLTYQREHKVVGWHQHPTSAKFLAVNCISSATRREDELWVIVQRQINNTTKFYLEKKAPEFVSDETSDAIFLDAYSMYEGVSVNTISDLEHLEGETVSILADGSVHPDEKVNSGTIHLNGVYNKVVVGIPYDSYVEPVLQELRLDDGSSIGRNQRILFLDIAFYRTLGCYIGRTDQEDGDHEEEIPFRVPGDLTGKAPPLFKGIKHLTFPEGYDQDLRYFIKQRQPLPLTVLSVTDTVEVND